MANILDRIVESKLREIAASKARLPERGLEAQLSDIPPVRDFTAALRVRGEIRVIAEVKKASPSAGVIRADFDAVATAKAYEANGAACVSVLTDEPFFQGRPEFLTAVKRAIGIPVLRKDFLLERYQLLEARAWGADAALLIAEILPGGRLAEMHRDAVRLGLHVLVECHDAEQLGRVLDAGATLVGINNRNLRTFETRLEQTLELIPRIPSGITVVSESGIRTSADLRTLGGAGVHAVLVGESLMRSPDVGAALAALRGPIVAE
ncbi:MAG TPA: indole-3-glycerol phosphate synthase TrpC [Fimbriiglobus sp.]|jgi:indole-3-glycerol phosphate synthase